MKLGLRLTLAPIGTLVAACAVAIGQPAFAQNGLDVYLSAPKSTDTIYSSTSVETFEEFSTGTYSSTLVGTIGTFDLSSTSKLAIEPDNEYGTGTGQYAALGVQTGTSGPVTLQLSTPQSYFGFSWNAGDANNQLYFYNGSTLVGEYTTATVTGLLSHPTVTTLGGQTYQSYLYKGQPVSGQDSNEPFAFINFFDNSGTFDKIVFANSNTTSTGFEFDNLTVRASVPTPDDTFVSVGSATPSNTPEPGSLALLTGMGLTGASLLTRRRRKK